MNNRLIIVWEDMMDKNKLVFLKEKLKNDGFVIDGIVGSYARGEKYNDIDILYHLDKEFLKKYKGFEAFIKLEEIKKNLENSLNEKVDIIDKTTLNKVGKKYILKDIIYVWYLSKNRICFINDRKYWKSNI